MLKHSGTNHPQRNGTYEYLAIIDHKNLAASRVQLLHILQRWLSSIRISAPTGVSDIQVRTYGGWYDGTTYSDERGDAITYYQSNLPTLFAVGPKFFRVHLYFAESLISDRPHTIDGSVIFSHTYAIRPSELATRHKSGVPACLEPGCRLAEVRRWIHRKKACLMAGCPNDYSAYFERRQQKQVDIHIATDLLRLPSSAREIALITADIDFLPAIVAFASAPLGAHLTWLRPNGGITYLDAQLPKLGVDILNT